MVKPIISMLIGTLIILGGSPAPARATCEASHVALQVLGSGGPFGDGRASAGYIIWIDGKSRIMIDAGGGTFIRFRQAQADISDLDLVALSHFHPDHSAELPALLWVQNGEFTISGPSGSDRFPSLNEYMDGLFGANGVFRDTGVRYSFNIREIDATAAEPSDVYKDDEVQVRALGVPHGYIPALGYRVDIGDISIAFSSDQNGSDPAWAEFASGVDLLVAHVATREDATRFIDTHAKPSVWGQMATSANAGALLVSHLRLGPNPDIEANPVPPGFEESYQIITANYDGPIIIAEDLTCVAVD